MDLTALLEALPPDEPPSGSPSQGVPAAVAQVVAQLGGVTLVGGLYRVFTADGVARWTAVAHDAHPDLRSRVTVFAADWLGRLLAADSGRRSAAGDELVLLLEPGTGEVLEVPCTVEEVHTRELLEAPDALVASDFYAAWREASGDRRPLRQDECVDYRVPLFLGGSDTEDNLERTDLDVCWSLSAQARRQTADLPPGTPVTSVDIAD